MKKLLFIAVLMALALACGENSDPIIAPPPPPPPVHKSDVLFNLQKAYNDRNITQYDRILDANFTFFLSDGDVNGGLPHQWGRADELTVSTHLFSRDEDPQRRWPLCTSIVMDVQFETNLAWVEIVNPPAAPTETWYTTTVFYNFQIEVKPDTKYIPYPGAKAQFTVRNAGTEEDPRWQLVEWHDLGGLSVAASRVAASTEQSTWGKVKSLYR